MARLKSLNETLILAEGVLLHGTPTGVRYIGSPFYMVSAQPIVYNGFALRLERDGLYLMWEDRRCRDRVQKARIFTIADRPLVGLGELSRRADHLPQRTIIDNNDRQWIAFIAYMARLGHDAHAHVNGVFGGPFRLTVRDHARADLMVPSFGALTQIAQVRQRIINHQAERGIALSQPIDHTQEGATTLLSICSRQWSYMVQWWGPEGEAERREYAERRRFISSAESQQNA